MQIVGWDASTPGQAFGPHGLGSHGSGGITQEFVSSSQIFSSSQSASSEHCTQEPDLQFGSEAGQLVSITQSAGSHL